LLIAGEIFDELVMTGATVGKRVGDIGAGVVIGVKKDSELLAL
jgi:hypothetical protein